MNNGTALTTGYLGGLNSCAVTYGVNTTNRISRVPFAAYDAALLNCGASVFHQQRPGYTAASHAKLPLCASGRDETVQAPDIERRADTTPGLKRFSAALK